MYDGEGDCKREEAFIWARSGSGRTLLSLPNDDALAEDLRQQRYASSLTDSHTPIVCLIALSIPKPRGLVFGLLLLLPSQAVFVLRGDSCLSTLETLPKLMRLRSTTNQPYRYLIPSHSCALP